MPVWKFRTLDEAHEALRRDGGGAASTRRLAWVLSFTERLAPRVPWRRGVAKFGSLGEAQADRERQERMAQARR